MLGRGDQGIPVLVFPLEAPPVSLYGLPDFRKAATGLAVHVSQEHIPSLFKSIECL